MNRALLFAHGAGAGSDSTWMRGWAERLSGLGRVRRFDYPYMARRGKGPPDRLPVLIEAHEAELGALRAEHPGPIVLIGKSMGGRVGCHVATRHPPAAVVCLGYPLRTPKGTVRDEVLLELDVPVLFVQGTRDALCPLPLLDEVRGRMRAHTQVHVVQGGNHSLEVARSRLLAQGRDQEDVDAETLHAIGGFLDARV